MPHIVGVKFKDSGKIYHFDPQNHHLELGDTVVVETVRGLEMGKVVIPITSVEEVNLVAELKPVVRQPTFEDYARIKALESRHDEVLRLCAERIAANRLPMRLVRADWSFDGTRLTVYFTSQQRVDFRHLVRELARIFRARIELRQVGARDEAKLLGGIGPCGRPLCCATFLPDFARVSVKMAKDQDLPLNPSKISGVCGRLLCCLSYEQEQYLQIKAELPTRGEYVLTPEGPGMVVAVNTIRETVTVDVDGNYQDFRTSELRDPRNEAKETARQRSQNGQAAPITNQSNREVPSRSSRDYLTRSTRPPIPDEQFNTEDEMALIEPPAPEASRRPQQRRRRDESRSEPPAAPPRQGLPRVPEQLTTRRATPDPDEPKPTGRRRRRGQRQTPTEATANSTATANQAQSAQPSPPARKRRKRRRANQTG